MIELQLLLATFAAWSNRQQAGVIAYLVEENRILNERHFTRWNGLTEQGTSAGSGVYFSEVRAGLFQDRKRMVLLR